MPALPSGTASFQRAPMELDAAKQLFLEDLQEQEREKQVALAPAWPALQQQSFALEQQSRAVDQARALDLQQVALHQQRRASDQARALEQQQVALEQQRRAEDQARALAQQQLFLDQQRRASEQARALQQLALEQQRRADDQARALAQQQLFLDQQRRADDQVRALEQQRLALERQRSFEAQQQQLALEQQRRVEYQQQALEQQRTASEQQRVFEAQQLRTRALEGQSRTQERERMAQVERPRALDDVGRLHSMEAQGRIVDLECLQRDKERCLISQVPEHSNTLRSQGDFLEQLGTAVMSNTCSRLDDARVSTISQVPEHGNTLRPQGFLLEQRGTAVMSNTCSRLDDARVGTISQVPEHGNTLRPQGDLLEQRGTAVMSNTCSRLGESRVSTMSLADISRREAEVETRVLPTHARTSRTTEELGPTPLQQPLSAVIVGARSDQLGSGARLQPLLGSGVVDGHSRPHLGSVAVTKLDVSAYENTLGSPPVSSRALPASRVSRKADVSNFQASAAAVPTPTTTSQDASPQRVTAAATKLQSLARGWAARRRVPQRGSALPAAALATPALEEEAVMLTRRHATQLVEEMEAANDAQGRLAVLDSFGLGGGESESLAWDRASCALQPHFDEDATLRERWAAI